MKKSTDGALVQLCRQGNTKAFDVLVLKYQHRIIGAIRRFIDDPNQAQDVAQDAFIKAYQALPKFRGDSEFYTWLYRIAINTAKNYLMQSTKTPSLVDYDVQDAEQYSGSESLQSDTAAPQALLLQEELHTEIFAAIGKLPEDLRMAITLRELEGFNYKQIADITDCPIGTVRSRIFRARELLNGFMRQRLGR